MSFRHGKNAVFTLDDSGGTARALRAFLNSVTGLPGARGLSEVTAFGDDGTKSIPSLANVTFSIAGHFDDTATTGIWVVLNSIRLADAASDFEYGPAGSTAGYPKITGQCWLTEFTVDASVSERVPIAATFQVEGIPTVGEFS